MHDLHALRLTIPTTSSLPQSAQWLIVVVIILFLWCTARYWGEDDVAGGTRGGNKLGRDGDNDNLNHRSAILRPSPPA
jgi:hypothetical protein